MISFKNCNIYLNNQKIVKSDLTIDDNKFSSFKANDNAITLDDKYIIVPGFIEQHMHGSKGQDVMYANELAIHTIASAIVADGITSWLPTTMTMAKQDIVKALEVVGNIKTGDNEAKIAGINLEGPFISKDKKGAQDDKYILTPNVKDMSDFVKASNNKIRITTVAVENATQDFINYCKDNNIVVSAGHSAADGSQLSKAIDMGVSCITHMYNAMDKSLDKSAFIPTALDRHIYCELILDLLHVPSDVASSIFSANKDKIILVSDAMEGRYMPNGTYKLGGNLVYVKDGLALLANGKKAGSVLRLPQALRNVKKVANLSLEETIDLVAKHPASNLGLKDIGCIKQGNWADFVVIDKDFNIYQTYINGKLVYDVLKK